MSKCTICANSGHRRENCPDYAPYEPEPQPPLEQTANCITIWEQQKDGKWEHNHFEYGWNTQDKIPRGTEEQNKKWKDGVWRKAHTLLIKGYPHATVEPPADADSWLVVQDPAPHHWIYSRNK